MSCNLIIIKDKRLTDCTVCKALFVTEKRIYVKADCIGKYFMLK